MNHPQRPNDMKTDAQNPLPGGKKPIFFFVHDYSTG